MPDTAKYRYYANSTLRRGLDPDTGEPIFFQRGDEIPASQFGSQQALMAAEHRGHITKRPILANGDSLEDRIAALERENAALRAKGAPGTAAPAASTEGQRTQLDRDNEDLRASAEQLIDDAAPAAKSGEVRVNVRKEAGR